MQINATVGGWVVVHDDDDDDVHTHSMSNCAQNAVCEYIIIFIVFKICSSDLFFGVESWTMRMLLVCYLLYKACYVCLLECLLDLNWCKKHQQRIEWLRKVSTRSIREMVWRIRQSVICSHVDDGDGDGYCCLQLLFSHAPRKIVKIRLFYWKIRWIQRRETKRNENYSGPEQILPQDNFYKYECYIVAK